MRLPDNSQRTVIVGRTGTGKTVAGLWLLSTYDLTHPWLLINFKNDKHINSIEGARHVDFDYEFTKKDQGLFVLHVMPHETRGTFKDSSLLEKFLWKLWKREGVGVLCDEGSMIGGNDAFDACLTQGRAKEIPMIICTQRPVGLTRYAFSEADFVQAFHLNDDRDRITVEQFTPLDSEDFDTLDKHCSFWYDIAEDDLLRLKPVPNMNETRATLDVKLPRRRVLI